MTIHSGGTGTPISPLPPLVSSVEYIPPIYTWLSLNRFAKVMGVDPVHFWGCNQINTASGRILHPLDNAQNNIWPHFNYDNSDQIGRDELARVIWSCEQEIADHLRMNLTPDWVVDEPYSAESTYLGEFSTGVLLRKSHFIKAGKRTTVFIANESISYGDLDSDGFDEVGSITVVVPAGAKSNEIKLYYPGYGGAREYEIRDAFSVSVAGGNMTFKFYSWQLVDPSLYAAQPNNDNVGNVVNLTDSGVLLSTVDAYWEYNDYTQTSVEFVKIDDYDVETYPTGYFVVRDRAAGIALPYEATYNVTTGAWESSVCTDDYTRVKLSYYSGYEDPRTFHSLKSDKLSDQFAKAIAYMAVSRLDRVYMTNTNATALADTLRNDARVIKRGEGYSRLTQQEMTNPFGTHYGEIYAWKALSGYAAKMGGGLV